MYIVFFAPGVYNRMWFLTNTKGVEGRMNGEAAETQVSWEYDHPWLSEVTMQEDDDSLDDVIRYTLDELRFT